MALYRSDDYVRRLKGSNPSGTCAGEPYRSDFRKDYGRLIHCAAFRRLKGKTQLFPEFEYDFFRNRLTHSIEVAQIAHSIAAQLNHSEEFLKKEGPIDLDLMETAALAHDLGHPPFGHNGEIALDKCMIAHGGFEGNAQTLRILSVLEKKATDDSRHGVLVDGTDRRFGLDLCARTMASILKYDDTIPLKRDLKTYTRPKKGYYQSQSQIVNFTKQAVLGTENSATKMRTIECSIMDIADDIAYSTYDLEDAFKVNLLTPIEVISAPNSLLERVASDINDSKDIAEFGPIDSDEVRAILLDVFDEYLQDKLADDAINDPSSLSKGTFIEYLSRRHRSFARLATVGYARTAFTAKLVGGFINSVKLESNAAIPALSRAYLSKIARRKVEVLKRVTYEWLISSPRLKVAEYRGKEIVRTLFKTLSNDKQGGKELLPDDFRDWYECFGGNRTEQMRVVCDFIAGMTDQYAVEFYARLRSVDPATIFKPM